MKKIIFSIALCAAALIITGCNKADLEEIENRIHALESDTRLATVSEQMDAASATVEALRSTASALQATASSLKGTLPNEYSRLETADKTLKNSINTLETDFMTKLSSSTKWAVASLMTQDMYDQLCDSIAMIRQLAGTIDTKLDKEIASLETFMSPWVNMQLGRYATTAQLNAELVVYRDSVSSMLGRQHTEIENRIEALKKELEEMQASSAAADSVRMDLLEAEIASNDSLLNVVKTTLCQDTVRINALQADVDSAKAQLTRSYNEAIIAAIEKLDGELKGEVADSVRVANARVEETMSVVKDSLGVLVGRYEAVSERVASLDSTYNGIMDIINGYKNELKDFSKFVQSIALVPDFDDMCVNAYMMPGDTSLFAAFQILPAAVADSIYARGEDVASLKISAGGKLIDLPFSSIQNKGDGILAFRANARSLRPYTLKGDVSVALAIKSEGNDFVSPYSRLAYSALGSDEIVYLSTNGVVNPTSDENVKYNHYFASGYGFLKFNADQAIDDLNYYGQEELKEIHFAMNGKFAKKSFMGCTSLEEITVPEGCVGANDSTFVGCTSLRVVNLPQSFTQFRSHLFNGSINLEEIWYRNEDLVSTIDIQSDSIEVPYINLNFKIYVYQPLLTRLKVDNVWKNLPLESY